MIGGTVNLHSTVDKPSGICFRFSKPYGIYNPADGEMTSIIKSTAKAQDLGWNLERVLAEGSQPLSKRSCRWHPIEATRRRARFDSLLVVHPPEALTVSTNENWI